LSNEKTHKYETRNGLFFEPESERSKFDKERMKILGFLQMGVSDFDEIKSPAEEIVTKTLHLSRP
jgi:hypothetical protein